jgi:hypothetical protein
MVVAAGGRPKQVRTEIDASDVLIGAPVISDPHNAAWAPWIDAFYAVRDVVDSYDIFCWHSYWQSAGGWLPEKLPPCFDDQKPLSSVLGKFSGAKSPIWQKMAAAGDDKKPDWCTEIGGAAKGDEPEHKSSLLSLAEQATQMQVTIDTLKSGKATKLDRIYWYCLFDQPTAKRDQAFYGILAFNDTNPITYTANIPMTDAKLVPKPAYEAYKNADKLMPPTAAP